MESTQPEANQHLPITRAAFGYLLDDAGRLLMVANAYEAGRMWGVPGGAREPGESPQACVVREFAEEVGLAVGITRDCGTIRRVRADWSLNLLAHFFEVELREGDPRIDPDDDHVVAFAWKDRDAIEAFDEPVLGRRWILDYLDRPGDYPKAIEMAPDEE